MNPISREEWQRIEQVLDAALDLPPEQRDAFVREACGGDEALRSAVANLLGACERDDILPNQPAAEYAAALVADLEPGGPEEAASGHERVGPYRVLREVGRGGMGIVYLAERADGHFRQQVALKVVRRGLHLEERLLRRFREERQILALLAHPHIARLLDGGLTHDGLPYFAMEFVQGEPIDRYADAQRLPVTERLQLFLQVCDAVEYAHQQRVVHRDIKPSNIHVTRAGEPKLLDFGIAKLLARDVEPAEAADQATTLTRTGERLLTPEYASPEQVRGEAVTPASDVYSLGLLLYELLAGRRPYRREGRTAHELERAILEEEPSRPSAGVTRPPDAARLISRCRGTSPERLRQQLQGDLDWIVLKALRKAPRERYASAGELGADVRRHLAGRPVQARGGARSYRARRFARRHRASLLAGAAGILAGVTLLTVPGLRSPAPGHPATGAGEAGAAERQILRAGATRRVAFEAVLELDPAISPDGRLIAYTAEEDDGGMGVYVKPVAGGRVTALTEGFPGYHRAPRWSPDGTRILFQSDGSIYLVPLAGGSPQRVVAPAPGHWTAFPAWSPDGRTIAYVEDFVIYTRRLEGGRPRRVAASGKTAAWHAPHSPAWSPDGEWIAFVAGNPAFVFGSYPWGSSTNLGNVAPSSIWVVPSRGGDPVPVTDELSLNLSPVWLPHGRALLFVSNRGGSRDIYQVPIGRSGSPAAPAVRLTTGLDAQTISLSADGGWLAFSAFDNRANIWSLEIPARGRTSADKAEQVTDGNQAIEGIDLSPDGRWLAFDSDRGGTQDIYKIPVSGGEPVQLTTFPGDDFMSTWSPNGREIAFYSYQEGRRRLQVISADGGPARPVVALPRDQRFPGWSPDGQSLVFGSDSAGQDQLYLVSRTADSSWGEARRFTSDDGAAGRWSPDGRWIVHRRHGRLRLTSPDGRRSRTVIPAAMADTLPLPDVMRWSPDGRTIYYKAFDRVGRSSFWAVAATGGTPRLLVSFDDPDRQSSRPEFATDGKRLYFTLSQRESDVWLLELTK